MWLFIPQKQMVDKLNTEQLKELDKAIEEADNKEAIIRNDFKKEMSEWRKKIITKRFQHNPKKRPY